MREAEVQDNQMEKGAVLARGSSIMTPVTTIHTIVMGMNTFQPSRMIWS